MDSEATREILWQIPQEYRTTMYVLLFVGMAVFFYGATRKILAIKGKRPFPELFPKKLNFKSFGQAIFFQGKIMRSPFIGICHALIFYGFIILWIATDLVAIHFDSPFKVFTGPVYIIISFLADFAGLAILIGITLAYYRRYIKKPEKLSAKHPNQEKLMYLFLFLLVVLGFALEGIRIWAQGMPEGEATWSPLGYALAIPLSWFSFNEASMATVYQLTWLVHMINTMVFFAIIPFTKFFHMISAPISALITPSRRTAILGPMDFEDEQAESFGLSDIKDLTFKTTLGCGRLRRVRSLYNGMSGPHCRTATQPQNDYNKNA